MKTIFKSLAIMAVLLSTASCKKRADIPEIWSGADWIVGNWSCDFNACEIEGVDSTLAIFAMVTDLQILPLNKLENGTVNTSFGWAGCVDASTGAVELHRSDKDEYDVFFVPYDQNSGLTGVEPYQIDGVWYLPGYNFDWTTLVPDGVSPNNQVLNSSKIYLKKVTENKMTIGIFYSDGSFKSYDWIRY